MTYDSIRVTEKIVDTQDPLSANGIGSVELLSSQMAIDSGLRMGNLLRAEVRITEIATSCGAIAIGGSWEDIDYMKMSQLAQERRKVSYVLSAAGLFSSATSKDLAPTFRFNKLLGRLKDSPRDTAVASELDELIAGHQNEASLFSENYSPQTRDKIAKRVKRNLDTLDVIQSENDVPDKKFQQIRRGVRQLAQAHTLVIATHSVPITAEAVLLRQISKRMRLEHETAGEGNGETVVKPSAELRDLIEQLG